MPATKFFHHPIGTFLLTMLLAATSLSHLSARAQVEKQDTARWMRVEKKSGWYTRQLKKAEKMARGFNKIDTNYIEPQLYNFTVMLQNTNNYEVYRLNNKEGQNIVFAPEPSVRIGPFVGWQWIFLGYTLDVKHINFGGDDKQRQEYDLSLYSSMVGIDFYYRKTGNDYKIRSLNLGTNIDTRNVEGSDFGGLTSTVKGLNIYYIFNHSRFSYPAAFSQSTVQRRSAGSPLLGIGYTKHTLSVNWNELNKIITEKLGNKADEAGLDSTMMFGRVKYSNISISGGYAYNWVFAHNWLMAGSITLGLAYKRTKGDMEHRRFSLRQFSTKNLNIDGTARFGIVWNNTRWYAGTSAILHAYNYRRSQFSTNNLFGNINIYAGFNFGRKGKKKKNKAK